MDDRWIRLLGLLRPDSPLEDMRLYRPPQGNPARRLSGQLNRQPKKDLKILLVGARGGGKSTELRAIHKELASSFVVAAIDLDRSGITATNLSAFDLLYVSAVAMLRFLPEKTELFESLKAAYAESEEQAKSLGDVTSALEGIAEFATVTTGITAATGALPGGGPIVGAIAAWGGNIIRLLTHPSESAISETSPRGQRLAQVANQVYSRVRQQCGKPVCVLVDGLEKMNGTSAKRFRAVFEETRLLYDTPWSAVFAAPPCTLSETTAAEHIGYTTSPVYGFGPDHLDTLTEILVLRVKESGLDTIQDFPDGCFSKIASISGGIPRDAIRILEKSLHTMADEDAEKMSLQHIQQGQNLRADELARGLTRNSLQLLEEVYKSKELPDSERAAHLFADGRILVWPPPQPGRANVWIVHPLLQDAIQERIGGK